MKKTDIIQNNNAVAGVIEALLIIALVSIILATIQLYYIPDIMEDKEKDHMAEVEKQFSYLKSTIDIQSMTKEKILISSPITLGSKELPYFVTMGAIGNIRIFDENDIGENIINIQPAPAEFPIGIPLTSIKYDAQNNYLSYDNEYIFEGGGIIAKKEEEKIMVKPPMIIENDTSKITIHYSLPLLTSVPGKKSYGCGYGKPDQTIFVRTNYSTTITYFSPMVEGDFIYIISDYLDAWTQALLENETGLFWEYAKNGDIYVSRNDTSTPPRIEIKKGNKDLDLSLTVIKIGVQIGPGIIRD